ncbi:50S ribosomal protein L10 [Ornithobacterium rhinotracheale]|uniref:Large ribosomal subunit protein uL10 n=1 Tax=Ornithobacterium rhinotracheale (strain ATCC 51463 / DSM 15997 / CCUG 23171 / CIP 104009 / LMG 9086) TaxID=867902 RepID=I4A177_ORNRL|nr:50S ribosomal protein L10 [Ornithobacterium rhinotracheale]AFL97711.1 ribosomal protein L10 [Ornithobacterium rhinotracheale DSM 15997]AIP99562.1 50S ribosomal protein L10 [Ornithobacterium rhinotracheale ORT-UMN 88]KGB66566.1 50S ribosomal protein L10 [Ornithobacterium rhinotracheale H06-030791]MBN3662573.1 50S ribosomal protein L10 [Ornithobacterium rhinotracheale]MCK0193989.1 50S ribosomal protein L10 [Ornithobacterium rhinotracheale]
MTREEKAQMIEDLTQVLSSTNTVYLSDISGLNSTDTSNLRRACFKRGVQLRVVKNTLLQKAMESIEDRDYEELYATLKGNTAIMVSEKENAPAKVIQEFRKKSEKPILKGAWIDSAVYVGDDKVEALSNLKSKEELIADVVALLQSPIKTVLSQLQSGGQTISGLVKALGERSE